MGPHGADRDLEDVLRLRRPPETAPSAIAQARLSDALRDRASSYRHDATVDLTLVEALLKLDEPEAAARTIDDHRALLQAMARDLQVAVADATVEREAERVVTASASRASLPAEPVRLGLRRRVLIITGAAAVAVALLLPTPRLSPRTMLASMDERTDSDDVSVARERLEAAKTWARALRAEQASGAGAAPELSARTAARNDMVRRKVRSILAADDPGGSAANMPDEQKVVDLEEYRPRRRAAAAGSPATSAAQQPAAPVDRGDDDGERPTTLDDDRIPAVKQPQGLDMSIDADGPIEFEATDTGLEIRVDPLR